MASKPAFSMTLAERASWQPGTVTARRSMMALRRTFDFFIGVDSLELRTVPYFTLSGGGVKSPHGSPNPQAERFPDDLGQGRRLRLRRLGRHAAGARGANGRPGREAGRQDDGTDGQAHGVRRRLGQALFRRHGQDARRRSARAADGRQRPVLLRRPRRGPEAAAGSRRGREIHSLDQAAGKRQRLRDRGPDDLVRVRRQRRNGPSLARKRLSLPHGRGPEGRLLLADLLPVLARLCPGDARAQARPAGQGRARRLGAPGRQALQVPDDDRLAPAANPRGRYAMSRIEGVSIETFRGDFEGLERMAHASWRDEYCLASFPNFYKPAFLHYLFERIPEADRDLLLGAYKDGEIVAFLANLPEKFHFEGRIYSAVYSCLLVVRKEYLRRGLAIDIIKAAVE